MESMILARVSGFTFLAPLRQQDTVAIETPASLATSFKVANDSHLRYFVKSALHNSVASS